MTESRLKRSAYPVAEATNHPPAPGSYSHSFGSPSVSSSSRRNPPPVRRDIPSLDRVDRTAHPGSIKCLQSAYLQSSINTRISGKQLAISRGPMPQSPTSLKPGVSTRKPPTVEWDHHGGDGGLRAAADSAR